VDDGGRETICDESGEGMRGNGRWKEGGMRRGRRQSAVFV